MKGVALYDLARLQQDNNPAWRGHARIGASEPSRIVHSTAAPAPETMMCVAKSGLPRPVAIDGIGELANEFRQ